MRFTRLFCFAPLSVFLVGCNQATSPLDDVTSRLEVPSGVVASGDTVVLRVIATNQGRERVAGVACSAGLDVEVRAPDGTISFVLLVRGLYSTCPLLDSNVLEAGETDTVSVRWRVPAAAGLYTLTGGMQVQAGLRALSAPQQVMVQ